MGGGWDLAAYAVWSTQGEYFPYFATTGRHCDVRNVRLAGMFRYVRLRGYWNLQGKVEDAEPYVTRLDEYYDDTQSCGCDIDFHETYTHTPKLEQTNHLTNLSKAQQMDVRRCLDI